MQMILKAILWEKGQYLVQSEHDKGLCTACVYGSHCIDTYIQSCIYMYI